VLDLQGGGGAAEGQLVQPGVCPPLDGLRGTLDTLPVLLTQACACGGGGGGGVCVWGGGGARFLMGASQ
jgi:hypothetical protein